MMNFDAYFQDVTREGTLEIVDIVCSAGCKHSLFVIGVGGQPYAITISYEFLK